MEQYINFLESEEANKQYFIGNPKLKEAVERLINRNKELEKENTELKTMDCVNIFELGKKSARDRIEYDYIPKSKVKEKIEELKEDIKKDKTRYPYILEHKIDILQELLEKRK